QESVWQNLPGSQRDNPRAIRAALTEGEVLASDRRVRFVGLDAYEAAGGAVRRDLFDADDGGYVRDIALLDALVLRGLETVADEVRAEGWKWVEARPSFGWSEQQDFRQGDPIEVALPDDIEAEADSLRTEHDELCDSDDPEDGTRVEAIERRLDEIDAMGRIWPDELKACAGAVVSLSHA